MLLCKALGELSLQSVQGRRPGHRCTQSAQRAMRTLGASTTKRLDIRCGDFGPIASTPLLIAFYVDALAAKLDGVVGAVPVVN